VNGRKTFKLTVQKLNAHMFICRFGGFICSRSSRTQEAQLG